MTLRLLLIFAFSVLGPTLAGCTGTKSVRPSFDTLIQDLDNGVIAAGTQILDSDLPKANVIDASYRMASQGRFGVYGVIRKNAVVFLFSKDGAYYAACGYRLSVDEPEKWWFADTGLLADYVQLKLAK